MSESRTDPIQEGGTESRAPDRAALESLIHDLQVYKLEVEVQNQELREAQVRLSQSQEDYQRLYDTAPVGYFTVGGDTVIRQANQTAETLLGVERSALVGSSFTRFVHERDQDLFFLHWRGLEGADHGGRCQLRLLRHGEPFWAQMDSAADAAGVGGERQWRTVVSDISDRVRVEQRLKQSEGLFRSISESAGDAIVATDGEGCVHVWNHTAEALFGYSAAEMIGENIQRLVPEESRAAHQRGMDEVARSGTLGGDIRPISVMGINKAGERIPVEIAVATWVVDDARWFSAIIRDLSKIRRLEAELLHAKQRAEFSTQAKSRFLAHMSHEIRTPLNVILGMAEELAADGVSAEQAHALEVMERAGRVMLSLVNSILDLSRIEAGRVEVERVDFDLHRLVDELMEETGAQLGGKQLALSHIIAATVPRYVTGDPQRLRQVLANLLGNAVKFTLNGEVRLGVAPDADGLLLFTVEDTGIGIPAEKLEEIFQPFTQAESFTTRRFGGSGLGLAITHQLVGAMGGRVWVESHPGQGSRFQFLLPLTAVSEEQAPPQQRMVSGAAEHDGPLVIDGRPLSLLLADDSTDNRILIRTFLKRSGVAIDEVGDGEQAVAAVKRGGYDVVLMDVQMPLMDGYSACREIRQWERDGQHPAVYIVALTAHALADGPRESGRAGCDLHLTKPIRKATLLNALADYIAHATEPSVP